MSGIHKLKSRRTTKDIDFAVLIYEKGKYEALLEYLIWEEEFEPYKDNSFVLIWRDKSQVDLLPFSTIEHEDGALSIEGLGLTSIHLQGFSEIYEEGLPKIDIEGKHQYKFCTLPGIMVLKMIAWDDRPEKRRDDIKDISDILFHFFDMYDHEIWENHNDSFEDREPELSLLQQEVWEER